MIEKTCCVTGHREIPADKLAYVKTELRKAVMAAADDGYTRFISGGAAGADLLFAAIVADLKKQGRPLSLETALPYSNRKRSRDQCFQKMLAACDEVKAFSERYSRGCYFVRNRYMVDESSRVIAVYDGRDSGGTVYTMQYACTKGKAVQVIKI